MPVFTGCRTDVVVGVRCGQYFPALQRHMQYQAAEIPRQQHIAASAQHQARLAGELRLGQRGLQLRRGLHF
jgi:hypothetical protein